MSLPLLLTGQTSNCPLPTRRRTQHNQNAESAQAMSVEYLPRVSLLLEIQHTPTCLGKLSLACGGGGHNQSCIFAEKSGQVNSWRKSSKTFRRQINQKRSSNMPRNRATFSINNNSNESGIIEKTDKLKDNRFFLDPSPAWIGSEMFGFSFFGRSGPLVVGMPRPVFNHWLDDDNHQHQANSRF